MTVKRVTAAMALVVATRTVHAARDVGSGNGAELATYVVEKGKPPVTPVR